MKINGINIKRYRAKVRRSIPALLDGPVIQDEYKIVYGYVSIGNIILFNNGNCEPMPVPVFVSEEIDPSTGRCDLDGAVFSPVTYRMGEFEIVEEVSD